MVAIKAILELMRPKNGLLGSLTIIIGVLTTRGSIFYGVLLIHIILGVITYFFVYGSTMIINDYYDYDIDKINRLERPIPRGAISLQQAKVFWIIVSLIGIGFAGFHSLLFNLGYFPFILIILGVFIGWFYSAWAKMKGFIGNIIVSVFTTLGLVYGTLLTSSIIPIFIIFFMLTIFFGCLSREIIKDCEDIEGDALQNMNSLPIKFGFKISQYIAFSFGLCSVLLYIFPMFANIPNLYIFIVFMLVSVSFAVYSLRLMLKDNPKKIDFSKMSLLLKISGFMGALAFLFGAF